MAVTDIKDFLELEYFEGEQGDGDYVDPHCTVLGVKNAQELPADLEIPYLLECDDCDYLVTEIESGAFKDCVGLRTVLIGDAVYDIGANAFSGCTGLKAVKFCGHLEYIGSDAFSGCNDIEEVHIDDLAVFCETRMGNRYSNPMFSAEMVVVDSKPLGDVWEIPEKVGAYHRVEKIRKHTLCGCKIKTLKFADGIKKFTIEGEALTGCDELISVILSDQLEEFDPVGLISCKNLKYNEYNGLLYLGSEKNPYKALVTARQEVTAGALHPDTEIICRTAFSNCKNLGTLYLTPKIKYIGHGAFESCDALTTVTVSEELKILDPTELLVCKNLKYNEYNGLQYFGSESNPYKALVTVSYKVRKFVLHPDTEIICAHAFHNAVPVSLTVTEGVTHINAFAFYCCRDLKSIYLPSTLRFIGDGAFTGCRALKEVHIPDAGSWCNIEFGCDLGNVKGTNPLWCTDLYFGNSLAREVVVPHGTESIKAFAFENCKTIKRVILPDGLKKINVCAFNNCTSLESINLPDSLESIGQFAFNYCTSLKAVTIPAVKEIEWLSFHNCTSLESVCFTAGTEVISSGAFEDCSSLKRVELPDGVKIIHQQAFRKCTSLREAVLPESVTEISYEAFEGCKALEKVTLPASVTKLCPRVFKDCSSLKEVRIPACEGVPQSAFENCTSLESAYISAGTKYLEMEAFSNCKRLKRVELPEGVNNIGARAFKDCISLHELNLPTSVRCISSCAFSNSHIEYLKLSEGVELYGEALAGMFALKRVEFPKKVKIGWGIFRFTPATVEIIASDEIKEQIKKNGKLGEKY